MEDLLELVARVRAARSDLDVAMLRRQQAESAYSATDKAVFAARARLHDARKALFDAVEGAPLVLSP